MADYFLLKLYCLLPFTQYIFRTSFYLPQDKSG